MKIGAAFSEHIKTEKIRKRNNSEGHTLAMRPFFLIILLIVLPVILLLKLANLQLVNGTYYRTISDSNRTRTAIIHAPRGIIFDRYGEPLVYNIPGFREIKGEKATLINRNKALDLLAKGNTSLEIDSLREYGLKEATAHILGYVGQITKEDLALPEYSNYLGTDVIGKAGIEQQYEHTLRGVDGKELFEVDAVGKKIRTLGETDPIPGKDIRLTIDKDLQQVAYEAMPDKKSVVIASTPDGEILAMVSKPSFDPNLFTMDETYIATNSAYTSVESILSDNDNQPLLNRAIGGIYPPGSTFKLVTAAAGLDNKIVNSSYTVDDTGVVKIGAFSFANWYYLEQGKTDGKVDMVKAIARSNDIFFYKLAEKITVDKLTATSAKFGLGQRLGIDISGEHKGLLPSKAWKQKNIGEPWYLGDTYHYGIGQGYLLTTPLQVNMWTAAIANKGIPTVPHLLLNKPATVKEGQEPIVTASTIEVIRKGMIDACAPGGVAFPLYELRVENGDLKIDGKNFLAISASASARLKNPEQYRQIPVACKTGTAQVGDEDTEPHAWITLFAPAYDPEIVVTVLVESGGQGSSVAAPIAKEVLEEWFGR